jgi:hypothetical protein
VGSPAGDGTVGRAVVRDRAEVVSLELSRQSLGLMPYTASKVSLAEHRTNLYE